MTTNNNTSVLKKTRFQVIRQTGIEIENLLSEYGFIKSERQAIDENSKILSTFIDTKRNLFYTVDEEALIQSKEFVKARFQEEAIEMNNEALIYN